MLWSTCAVGESSCQQVDEVEWHSRPCGHGYAAAIQLQHLSAKSKKHHSSPYTSRRKNVHKRCHFIYSSYNSRREGYEKELGTNLCIHCVICFRMTLRS